MIINLINRESAEGDPILPKAGSFLLGRDVIILARECYQKNMNKEISAKKKYNKKKTKKSNNLRRCGMTFEEKTIKSQRIYEGAIINLRRDEVTVQKGTSKREIIEHNGGAVLAAVTDTGKLVMVRQYRKAAERVMLEVPAGKIDPGESPEDAAKRELKEETGYTAGNIKFLMQFYPSVGYSEEILYLYLCTELTSGETNFDENEAIDIEEYEVNKLYKMAMDGDIQDAKTIIAVLTVRNLIEAGKIEGETLA